MNYWILIFNQQVMGTVNEEQFLQTITASNYETLCRQYGLSALMIEPALANLKVVLAPGGFSLFFLLHYHPQEQRPIVGYQWDSDQGYAEALIRHAVDDTQSNAVKNHLPQTQFIFGIELAQSQLRDMGLLLAYEVARWAADEGQGIIRGLDGNWYRLNQHKAFVPIDIHLPETTYH